jgi:PAS domain S-box-containing protein
MTPIVQARLLGISAIALLSLLLLGFLTVVIIMRASEEGFRQLFEHAVDILILHDKGKITAVNKEACRRLGYTREELLQKSLFDIEVGIGKEDLLTLWEQGGELVTINGMYRCRDGSTFPVEIRAGEISYQGRNLRLAAVRDVTERQEAERALHTERQRLFNLLNELQASIYLKRPDYSVVYANKFFLERFGEPGARLCYEIIFGRRQPCDRCPSSIIFATGQPQEWEATSPNGHTYQVYGYPFADVDGSPLVLEMGIDITARKRAEMELAAREEVLRRSQESYRRLATQLMTFQETERQRLARELHDDLTQRLAVLAMEAETLEMQMSRSPGAAPAKLKEIKNNLVKLSMDVHAISRRLHPSILDDLGLADAIASECASFRQRQGVVVNYHAAGIPASVPRETAINLYRIAQEALRNISSHAQATTVDVTLIGENDSLNLSIKDNGQGFDTQGKKLAGLGLASMQERAFLIGAEFAIRSQPGNGTRIDVTAPLTRRTA